MCSRGLLLSVTLLGLMAGGISQDTTFPSDPVPTESCRSPDTSTVVPGPKCDYMMIVPFKLTSGSQGTVCTWLKSEVPVAFSVAVEYFSVQLLIFSKSNTSDHYGCTEFTVPIVDKETTVFFTFSAASDEVNVADRKAAVIDVPRSACLAQKDKLMYNRGDTIQLLMTCYDENMMQVVKNFTKVLLVDPNGIPINQILNPTQVNGVLSVSFTTSSQSQLGYWRIEAVDDKEETQWVFFQLQNYDLPRFDWNANCPSTISVLDRTATINGSAQYVYGEPVQGTVVVRCCRTVPKYGREANCFRGLSDLCYEFTKELDENGKFCELLDLDQFKLPFSGLSNALMCDITLKEMGTDVLVPSSCYMQITNRLAVLQMDRTSIGSYYNKVHLPFVATLTDEKGNPLAFRTLKVKIDGVDVKYVTTDANGRAECVIDTTSYYNPNITLSVFYEDNDLCYGQDPYSNYYIDYDRTYPYDEMVLYRFYSKSQSHIRIRPLQKQLSCYQNYNMQLDYVFTEEGVGKGATTTSIKYIFVSRNHIAAQGEIIVDLSRSYKGSASIEFHVGSRFATGATLVVFATLAKDIISDTATVNTGSCFDNEVNMEFTEKIVAPGATVDRKITAAPGSFCGFRAQDTAFKLLNSYDEFNPSNVYNQVYSYLFRLYYQAVNYEDPAPACINGDTEQFCDGVYVKKTSSRTDREAYQDFVDVSIQLFTNLDSRRPRICGLENEFEFEMSSFPQRLESLALADGPNFRLGGGAVAKSFNTLRSDFRDAFGAGTAIVGPDGVAIVTTTIPQKITSWYSDAFCISSEKGLGLTIEPAITTTFQEFFVEISIPSEVIRGEQVITNIVISNYMDKSAQVEYFVDESADYQVTHLDNNGPQCVGSQKRAFWKVALTFLTIGKPTIGITGRTTKISDTCDGPNDDTEPSHSDKIIVPVNSRAEGIPREDSSSHLVIVSDETKEVNISVVEPDDLVSDSFTLQVKVMGDPVALSAANFENLLSAPSGCCDQMQSSVLSIIFLSDYLEEIGELSDDLSKKMLAKLSTGYMDMITCRQYDGGFGRYPTTYEVTSWGTILSLRTLFHLSRKIYVDKSISSQTLVNIGNTQDLESGCLNPQGYSSINQENVNPTMQYTALAASILQELNPTFSAAGPLLEGAKRCLDSADLDSQDTLTQCYMLNAAASGGDFDKWETIYNVLEPKGISNGDILYWRNDNVAKLKLYQFFPTPSDGDVLITSCMLISMTKHPNPSQDLLNKMGSIAKYLSGRMTKRGGFYAAQPTSWMIEALTRFGRTTNTKETDVTVSLLQNGNEVFNVAINKDNKFVMQSKEIQGFGDCTFVVRGTGSSLVQLSASYNTKIAKKEDSAFGLTVQSKALDCFGGVAKKVDITISVSYIGERVESSDTIIYCSLLTGYSVDFSSVNQHPNIAAYRMHDGKALFYLTSVTRNETVFTISTYMNNKVLRFQKPSVVVQDLETAETGAASYQYPCDSEPVVE